MKLQDNPHLLLVALVLLTMAGVGGCSSGGGRGSLSQATTEATERDEERGRENGRARTRSGSGTSDPDDDPYEYEDYSSNMDDWDSGGSSESKVKEKPNLILWYSRSNLAGDAVEGFSSIAVMYSGYPKKNSRYRGHLGLYYGWGRLGDRQDIQDSIRWISDVGLEIGARRYFTSQKTLMGLYLMTGIRFGGLYWSYIEAIESQGEDGGTDTISRDGVFLIVPYLGVGASFLQTDSVHLGASFTAGGWVTLGSTFQEFDNDMFRDVGELKLNFEASFFF